MRVGHPQYHEDKMEKICVSLEKAIINWLPTAESRERSNKVNSILRKEMERENKEKEKVIVDDKKEEVPVQTETQMLQL